MKREDKKEELYQRFLKNEATSAELTTLFDWFAVVNEEELRELIVSALAQVSTTKADRTHEAHLQVLHAQINARINELNRGTVPLATQEQPSPSFRRLFSPVYKVAASLLLICGVAWLGYQEFIKTEDGSAILPGCNCATLVLPDGSNVDLKVSKDTVLRAYSGVTIHRTADGRLIYTADAHERNTAAVLNSIVTPLGGRYRISLSDGTMVVLNSGSRLDFPVGFHGDKREVRLTGEAYFEVMKDPLKPFIVTSGAGSTEVLGTKFNVSSYPEDKFISTTLLEGKVRFISARMDTAVVLKPGEQANLSSGQLSVREVNAADFMGWKDNKFIFRDAALAHIMKQLSRWYNIEVDYNSLPDRNIYANISADVPLSEVLRMLSVTSGLKFKVEGRRISVMK